MILQIEIDGLGYCHGAPPVVGVVGGNAMKEVYTMEGVAESRGDVYSWISSSAKFNFYC